jgi:hypothetical protein
MGGAARVAAEVVPFIGALPDRRQVPCRWVDGILDTDRCGLDFGVACEIGADEPTIPGPLILGVAGRVDPDEPAASSDVALEGSLLGRSKAAFWVSSRRSPVVLRNTTTLRPASSVSVKRDASSVLSTAKPWSAPSALMAAIPCGIESWRKPVVFEKTRTANLGCVPSASATRLKSARRTLKTISSDETLAFTEPVCREGVRCPGGYELANFMIIIITRAGLGIGRYTRVDRVLPPA